MAYTKQTWVDNQSPLTAARMNTIENGIAAAKVESDYAKAHLYSSAAQTGLAGGTYITVSLDTALIDTHGGLSVADHAFKVPVGQDGIYLVDGSSWIGGQVSTYLTTIYVNGGARIGADAGGSTYMVSASYGMGVSAGARLLNLVAGDKVTLMAYSITAGWQTNSSGKSWMTVLRVA